MEEILSEFILTADIQNLLFAAIAFIFIDILTGYLNAIKHKNVSSSVSRDGIIKKLAYFIAILVGLVFDLLLFNDLVLNGIVCIIITTELISITENLAELGIKVPILYKYCNKDERDE